MPVSTSIDNSYSAIGFYGVTATPDALESFYRDVLAWCYALGCQPTHLAVDRPKFPKAPGKFKTRHAALMKLGFAGISAFEINVLGTGGKVPVSDSVLKIAFNDDPSGPSYALLTADSSLVPWSKDALLPFVRVVSRLLSPEYGIGFRMEREFGPTFYIVGLSQGINSLESEENYDRSLPISRWGYRGMMDRVWRQGIVRDIYPWSFLTAVHLDRPVGQKSIREWILEKPSRGTLSPLNDQITLWEVEEPNIPTIRQALSEAGVIFRHK